MTLPRARLHPLAAAAAAFAALMGPQLAPAQTPSAAEAPAAEKADAQALERIVVTATKRDVPAYKVPINVTAIGEDQLREQNITDLKKLIANSPSIDAPANSARFADSVTVRGLNISSVSANNIEWFVRSTLSYYLDDAPLPNIGYRIKDIARVETLLGPQGTLYGGGSLGGTIRYITNQPVFGKTEGRLSTSLYQTRFGGISNDTDGVVNLPMGENLALRVVLARLDEKGYTDRYAGTPGYLSGSPWTPKPNAGQVLYEDDDYQKVDTGRVSARWRLTPELELTLSHAQQSQTAHGTSGAQLLPASGNPGRYLAPLAFNDHTVLSPYPEVADRDFRMTTLDLDWKLPIGKLHSSTSTYKDTRVGQADYLATGSFFYGDLGYPEFTLGDPAWIGSTAFVAFDNAYKGTVHETRITSNPGGDLDWIAGLYYATQDKSLRFTENLPGLDPFLANPGSGPTDVGYFENQASKYRESALFGELSYRPVPDLTVTAGARLFSYRDDTTTEVVDYAFDLVSGANKASEKKNGKAYFKLNAAYQLNPDLLGYATFSQGFRRGGANGFRQGGNALSAQARAYKPVTTDNYELGLKGFLLDRRLYLQADVFLIDWKDTQTYFSQDVNGFPVWGTINGPDSQSKGLELQGRYRLGAAWQVDFGSTYTRAQWDKTREICLYADNTECRTYTKGGELGGTPRWKHFLGLRWDSVVGDDIGLSAALRARYTGRKASDRGDAPGDKIFDYEATTTLGASLGLSKGPWDANLWVENLTDQRKLTSFQGTSSVASRTGLRAIYLTPRTVGVNLSYRF
jgi:outer membrane receptor protein involved in Fe transport